MPGAMKAIESYKQTTQMLSNIFIVVIVVAVVIAGVVIFKKMRK